MSKMHTPDGPDGVFVLPFADVSHIADKQLDLAYADASPFQALDLYFPEGKAPEGGWPLLIYVHGGAWMMCDKRDIQLNSPLSLTNAGYAVASVNYRLTGEAQFPAQIYDVKAAIRFLRANAAKWNIDTGRFALWGCSAGGHLVSLAATTNGVTLFEDFSMGNADISSEVHAVVCYYGPTKLDEMDQFYAQTKIGEFSHLDADSPESRLLGGVPTEVPAQVIAANPETWVTKHCPPFFLAHAPLDPVVPVQHSVVLSQKITAIAGEGRAQLKFVQNAGHATPEFDEPELTAEVISFLNRVLASPSRS